MNAADPVIAFLLKHVKTLTEQCAIKDERVKRLAERSKEIWKLICEVAPSNRDVEAGVSKCLDDFKIQNDNTLMKRLVENRTDGQLDALLDDLANLTSELRTHASSSSPERQNELARSALEADRRAREADRKAQEEQCNTLLRNQSRILEMLEIQESKFAEALEALGRLDLNRDTAQMKVAELAYKTLVIRTNHNASLVHESDISDITEWELDLDKDPISAGGFGDVYAGVWLGHTKVAVKRLRVTEARQKEVLSNFRKEVKLWRTLRHPNVLLLLGACFTAPQPFMVSPFMSHGTLPDYVKQHSQDGHRLLMEAARGMHYLHSRNVIHGDLKGVQILISDSRQAVIADFGFSVCKVKAAFSALR
ncbi:hypothetical protein HDV00_007344 [Rhizophlyctis rosea]|nr:hypothetical protein HDV00_007344 [Rhizophlyctis rosea]